MTFRRALVREICDKGLLGAGGGTPIGDTGDEPEWGGRNTDRVPAHEPGEVVTK